MIKMTIVKITKKVKKLKKNGENINRIINISKLKNYIFNFNDFLIEKNIILL